MILFALGHNDRGNLHFADQRRIPGVRVEQLIMLGLYQSEDEPETSIIPFITKGDDRIGQYATKSAALMGRTTHFLLSVRLLSTKKKSVLDGSAL